MSVSEAKNLSLDQAAEYLLEECRMVLPGIQALFGFQLIAVFNAVFKELDYIDQRLHIAAIGLVAVGIGFIMTPAALHRQTSPRQISQRFIAISTRLLLISMFPLAAAIGIEFYIVSMVVLRNRYIALSLAVGLLVILILLWFVLPQVVSRRREVHNDKAST